MFTSNFGSAAKLFLVLAGSFQLLPTTNQSPINLPAVANATSPYYTAGVVEFSSSNSLEDNLVGFLELISSADAESTDIIVFPESTLNNIDTATYVPDPDLQLNTSACLLGNTSIYSDFLVQLSCSARQARKYLVINLTERENCSTTALDPRPCASNGLNIYNTNVVFDREGRVISRYRKWNLYGEPKNTTATVELSIFETDFGVRFGQFTCFDILFYEPTQTLVDLGIRDLVYPTMWFSQLPFLTAVQVQQSWSYINDVNFLAAGANRPAVGSTGTGIYAGREGALVSVMNTGSGVRQLYVAQVPKLGQTQNGLQVTREHKSTTPALQQAPRLSQADIFLKRDYMEEYNTMEVNHNSSVIMLWYSLCYKKFCCSFTLWPYHVNSAPLAADEEHYVYRVGVFEGRRYETGAETTNALRTCAVFACTGPNITDCGTLFAANVTQKRHIGFTRIMIEADFPTVNQSLLMPNSLRDDLLPLDVNEFEWDESQNEDGTRHVRYVSNTNTTNLLTFAIYGNYYDDLGWNEEETTTTAVPTTEPGAGDGVGTLVKPFMLMWILAGLLSVVLK
ncbi:PREDICTED: vanin-like protein 2 [Rhagoletis zephyria]|uniref:vanin-like protein 2 n=1 Tax=Rhagoletis zephyria TaxID=28612 RepID=UPI00081181A7|nr:PREDICTED: vanin-like protein 2 [Rhagoletis zephyria]